MVLQNKYKRAASARYQGASSTTGPARSRREPDGRLPRSVTPTHLDLRRAPEDALASASSDTQQALESGDDVEDDDDDDDDVEPSERRVYSKRALRSNAGRYRELEELATLGCEGEGESDGDREARVATAQRDAELDAFNTKLRSLALTDSSENRDLLAGDVDKSFDHLFRHRAPRTSLAKSASDGPVGETPGLTLDSNTRMRDAATRAKAAKQLKAHFAPSPRPQHATAPDAIELDDLLATLNHDREHEGDTRGVRQPAPTATGTRRGRTAPANSPSATGQRSIEYILGVK